MFFANLFVQKTILTYIIIKGGFSMFSYSIDIMEDKKTIICTYSGTPTVEEGQKYVEYFKSKIAAINRAEYAFISDATNIIASMQDAVDLTHSTMEMYLKLGFRKVIMVRPTNFISLSQYRRTSTDVTDQVIVVDSREEALAEARK